jgi:hypothetical protein
MRDISPEAKMANVPLLLGWSTAAIDRAADNCGSGSAYLRPQPMQEAPEPMHVMRTASLLLPLLLPLLLLTVGGGTTLSSLKPHLLLLPPPLSPRDSCRRATAFIPQSP